MLRSMPGEAQRTWLVQFYTPWCGRCRKFHDAWSELAEATPGQRSADAELRLARLDARFRLELEIAVDAILTLTVSK